MDKKLDLDTVNRIFYQLLDESDYTETNLFKWVILQCWYDLITRKKGVISAIEFLNSEKFEWKARREEICEIAFTDIAWLDAAMLQEVYKSWNENEGIRNRITNILIQFEKGYYSLKESDNKNES